MILQKRISKVGIKGDAHVVITSGDYGGVCRAIPYFSVTCTWVARANPKNGMHRKLVELAEDAQKKAAEIVAGYEQQYSRALHAA